MAGTCWSLPEAASASMLNVGAPRAYQNDVCVGTGAVREDLDS
jgi:hypothetical protein